MCEICGGSGWTETGPCRDCDGRGELVSRSFPDAADGTPTLPMEPELWAAGCDHDTAKFTAGMLRQQGYYLVRPSDLGWDDIRRYHDELKKGQDIYEDGGGFFLRAIRVLLRIQKPDTVTTYQTAATEMLKNAEAR